MKAFADVSAALQVGVRRSAYSRSEVLGEWPCESVESGALIEAGALDLMRRAGVSGSRLPYPLEAARQESRLVAQASAAPLLEAIDLGLFDLVLDWARAAALKGQVAPHSALVQLLGRLPKDQKELIPVLGQRGLWLASLMKVEVGLTESGYGPAEHRQWLQTEWETLDWKQRAEGLTKLAENLSPSDERILTVGLTDRRKEVRENAAKYLVRINSSVFAQELEAFAHGRIRVERKLLAKNLSVALPEPEELPKSLPRTPPRASFGPKAHALFDLVRLVKPSFWEAETGLSVSDLLVLAQRSEYADPMIYGWMEAASASLPDQRWIDALFRCFQSNNNREAFRMLAPLTSLSLFEEAYRGRLNSKEYLPTRDGTFTAAFSKLVVEAVRQETVYVDKGIERCLDPTVIPMLKEPWDSGADSLREHWYRSMDLRKRLVSSLNS